MDLVSGYGGMDDMFCVLIFFSFLHMLFLFVFAFSDRILYVVEGDLEHLMPASAFTLPGLVLQACAAVPGLLFKLF